MKEAWKILGRRGIRYKGMGACKNMIYLENSQYLGIRGVEQGMPKDKTER